MAEPGVASRSAAARPRAATRRPTLKHGDRLRRGEFERRYALRPDLKKAQLIEGVVYLPSPVSVAHSEPHAMILGILLVYSAFTPGVRCYDNATVRLNLDNEPQPDALLRIEPQHGGQSRVSEDGYIARAPELIVEVATTSSSVDLHDKLRAYRRNGVREYVVWRTHERRIDWFELAGGEYHLLPSGDDGAVESRLFPGLRIAVPALLAGNLATALDAVNQSINSPEHRRFVARLAPRR